MTKINCAVAYLDVVNGEVQSDAILVDTERITIGGIGTLDLESEEIDLVLTPRPKNPTFLSLAHTIRLTGPLSDPEVTNNKFHIAEGRGWSLLALATPIGWTLVIPKITGTSLGTGKHNPCAVAMASRQHTAQEVEELEGGFLQRVKKFFNNLGESSDALPPSE